MVSFKFTLAALAASLLTMVAADDASTTVLSWTTVPTHIPTATTTLPASAMQSIGCFETGIPLQNYGSGEFQSPGQCQLICLMLNKNVMGLSDGENCWCGDRIPAKIWQTNNSTCGTTCSGTTEALCGGDSKLWVVLTGNTRNPVQYYDPPVVSSSASSSSRRTSATSTPATSQTASASASPTQSSGGGGGTNTAAIAAGVVVGVVGLAAIIGGVLYFMRRRRQKQAEEDYRRNAANVNDFVAGGKLHTSNSSMNDSRLDPIFVDRRQSNGSIADNEDYSRRILKVTNA